MKMKRAAVFVLLAVGPFALGQQTSLSRAGGFSSARPVSGKAMPKPMGTASLLTRVQLSFIENQGQFPPDVKFQVKRAGQTLWLTNSGITFDVVRPVATGGIEGSSGKTEPPQIRAALGRQPMAPPTFERLAFSENFTGGQPLPDVEVEGVQPGTYNYFVGNDQTKWRMGVRSYSQVVYREVWPGIDVRFAAKGGDVEQEFIVRPGADASKIRISYRGVEGVNLSKDGSLAVRTLFGVLSESAPRIYEEVGSRRTTVAGRFAIWGDFGYEFRLGFHNAGRELVIDPTLLFSTYIGGSGADVGNSIAVDSAGNVYMAGSTSGGAGYPTSAGVIQSACLGANCSSGVVTSLDALGRLRYSTYLGSSAAGNQARGIAVDAVGNAYVAGLAQGGDFPTTSSSAFQTSCSGSAFLSKLDPTGSKLLYSTCIGADDLEATTYYGFGGATAVAIDSGGRAYLTGDTEYSGYPTTANAAQPAFAGVSDAFVAVIDPSLAGDASLVYCSYLGGESYDYGRAIAVDAYGNAYITGSTYSPDFPVTAGAFQSSDPEGACVLGTAPYTTGPCFTAFVIKLNPNISGPSGLIYSTYLGGSIPGHPSGVGDVGYAIAVDSSGNAYVAGSTDSFNFPTTSGAYQTSSNCSGGFVTKVNAGGSGLVYSTFLSANSQAGGGSCTTSLAGIALDLLNNAYVAGSTRSIAFPVTANAFQSTKRAGGAYGYDATLTELSASGASLIYSSYLGGGDDDSASAVAVDGSNDVYVTGSTGSFDFPVTSFAFQPVFSDGLIPCTNSNYHPCSDAFVTKFPLGGSGGTGASGASASYVGADTSTQGTWTALYGSDGYLIANGAAAAPSYAAVSFSEGATYTWASATADLRALQTVSDASSRIASTYYSFASLSINVNLTDGDTHRVALYLLDWDSSGRAETVSVLDAITNEVLSAQSFSSFHNGVWASWNVSGNVIIQVTVTGGANAVVGGIFFDPVPTATAPTATATYAGPDATTQGTWSGMYGANGNVMAGETAAPPSYATVGVSGAAQYVWAASTGDTRGLQVSGGSSGRVAATYYASGSFAISVNVTDGNTHRVALYLLDWDSNTRAETISVIDANRHVLLDRESYSNFNGGVYAVWDVRGSVTLTITDTSGANAVVAGLFFDPTPSASYLETDTSTQGAWTGKYGSAGELIANDLSNPPGFSTVSLGGDGLYTWNGSTTDPRALQISSGATSGIASAYYSFGTFSIHVNLADGNTHKVSLYLLDWDSTSRAETVSVKDAISGQLLSTQSYSAFQQGQWAVWTVKGNVIIEVTDTGGANAVVSGVFFD